MQLTKTWPQTLAYGETKIGLQYSEVLDGGTGPTYFDCSGLMQNIMRWAGDASFPRDTWEQWDDTAYERHGPFTYGQCNPASIPAGAIVSINVVGENNNDPPQHTGLCVGNGQYLNAPHTGATVQIEPIPNGPSEFVYGYLVPVYASAPAPAPTPTPPPEPPPTLQEDEVTNWDDVDSNGTVITRHVTGVVNNVPYHWWQPLGGAQGKGTNGSNWYVENMPT